MKSLSIAWIKRLSDESKGKWKVIPKLIYKTHDLKFLFSCNHKPIINNIQPVFYRFIQNTWAEINEIHDVSAKIIHNQYIWNNRYLTIDNQSFIWKRWKDAGINKINDIYANNNFLSIEDLRQKYGLRVNFLEVLQIRQSLPFAWRSILINHTGPRKERY